MGSRALFAIVGGFLIGVFIRSFVPIGTACVMFIVLLGLLALAGAFFNPDRRVVAIVAAIFLLSTACGIVRMSMSVIMGDVSLTDRLNTSIVVEGFVFAEPDVRDTGTRLSVTVTKLLVGSSTIPIQARVLVEAPSHIKIVYGDIIRVQGKLELPKPFDTNSGRQFNYPYYLGVQGIGYVLSFAKIEDVGKNEGNILKAGAIQAKQIFLRGLQSTLPEPEAGFAGGITVGDKRSIGAELSADFQKVSLIHMIVLSGYNITIVINVIARMLQYFPRAVRFGGSIFTVLFFILMSGGAASATRAGLMALLATYARQTHRVFDSVRALGVVALGMVVWNPFTLAFDPSFQLSALATLGLMLFTPHIAARIRWIPEKFGLREIISSTLGTQLIVLPFLLYQNGQLSPYGLPANLLALVPVPLAMLFSCIAAVGGMLFGHFATIVAFPAYLLLAYVIGVAEFFAHLPFFGILIPTFSVWWMFGAYTGMLLIWWRLQKGVAAEQGSAAHET